MQINTKFSPGDVVKTTYGTEITITSIDILVTDKKGITIYYTEEDGDPWEEDELTLVRRGEEGEGKQMRFRKDIKIPHDAARNYAPNISKEALSPENEFWLGSLKIASAPWVPAIGILNGKNLQGFINFNAVGFEYQLTDTQQAIYDLSKTK